MRPFGSEGLREGHGGLGPSCSGPVLGKPSGGTNVRAFRSRNSGRSRDSGSVGGGRVWPKLLRVTLPKAIHPSRLFGELRPCFCGAGQQAGSVRCPGSSLYARAGCSQQSLAGLGFCLRVPTAARGQEGGPSGASVRLGRLRATLVTVGRQVGEQGGQHTARRPATPQGGASPRLL